MNQFLIKFILTPLVYIYFAGLLVFGGYFNWQYAQGNGFFQWLVLGEMVPTLQSTIWPYYAASYFLANNSNDLPAIKNNQAMQPPRDGRIIAAFKDKAWWLSDYRRLNSKLDKAGGSLSASYRTGPKNAAYVKMQIEREPSKGLTLKLDLPPEALVSINPKTGKAQPGKERTLWTYRDHDLDGMPDDFSSQSLQNPSTNESFTNDGFVRVRDSADHSAILVQWTIGLAFSTNHFLYDKDSVSP